MPTDRDKPSRQQILKIIVSRRMLVALAMGFVCGMPLLLTISVPPVPRRRGLSETVLLPWSSRRLTLAPLTPLTPPLIVR